MDKRLNEIDSVTSANDIVNVITLPSNADAKKATMTQLAEALIKTSEGKQIVAEAIGAYLTQAGLTTTFDGVVTTNNNKLSLINSDTLAQVVAEPIKTINKIDDITRNGIYLFSADSDEDFANSGFPQTVGYKWGVVISLSINRWKKLIYIPNWDNDIYIYRGNAWTRYTGLPL